VVVPRSRDKRSDRLHVKRAERWMIDGLAGFRTNRRQRGSMPVRPPRYRHISATGVFRQVGPADHRCDADFSFLIVASFVPVADDPNSDGSACHTLQRIYDDPKKKRNPGQGDRCGVGRLGGKGGKGACVACTAVSYG
jgi:hypothetical protein